MRHIIDHLDLEINPAMFFLSKEDLDKIKDQFRSFDEENPIKIFESPTKMFNGVIIWWQWVTGYF